MKKMRDSRRDSWEDEYFIDVTSSSDKKNRSAPKPKPKPGKEREEILDVPGEWVNRRSTDGPPRRPPRQQPRQPRGQSQKQPQKRRQERQPSQSRRAGGPEGRRGSSPPQKRRPRKKMSRHTRALLSVFTFLGALVGTALLCIFLLFKVSTIEVTGDVVYEQADILKICSFNTGDNLVFLPVESKERELEKKLPYVEKAEIIRHLPGTVEINIKAAKVGSCLESGGSWLYVSADNKILERSETPLEGVMQVSGITLVDSTPGAPVKMESAEVESAYEEIIAKLVELEALHEFTKLDISDPYNISLWYQDRIQFLLGNAADLSYKIQFGHGIVVKKDGEKFIGAQEHGTLDLTLATEVKRSTFTATTQATPAPEASSGDSSESGGRGGDIPTEIYTGSDPDSSSPSSADDTGSTDAADYTDGYDTGDENMEDTDAEVPGETDTVDEDTE